uniref:Uncharacterized protein n=1 Tax=Aotus nancymaae TaxID=37293 RepID=A0A2K5C1W3_AOTNA
VIVPLHRSPGGRRPCLSQIKIKRANHCSANPSPHPCIGSKGGRPCWGKLRVLEKEKQEGASLTRNCFPQNCSCCMSPHSRPQPSSSRRLWVGYRLFSPKLMLRFRLQCGRCWDVGSNRSCMDSSWRD